MNNGSTCTHQLAMMSRECIDLNRFSLEASFRQKCQLTHGLPAFKICKELAVNVALVYNMMSYDVM